MNYGQNTISQGRPYKGQVRMTKKQLLAYLSSILDPSYETCIGKGSSLEYIAGVRALKDEIEWRLK